MRLSLTQHWQLGHELKASIVSIGCVGREVHGEHLERTRHHLEGKKTTDGGRGGRERVEGYGEEGG